MSYQNELKQHLADFKHRHLSIIEPGLFRYRGRHVPRDHILPLANAAANIFDEALSGATAFLAANPAKRHRYFHHLNSSQAFAFNLFFPWFDGDPQTAATLLRALGQNGVLAHWELEKEPAPEEQSSIDVFWTTVDGSQTFCEVKLSEAEFGTAINDARHREKLARIYAPGLADHLDPARLEPAVFFRAYQFNRNVWHMVRAGVASRLIFLLPRANAGLWAQLGTLLTGLVPSTRNRIQAVAIEDVIASLIADNHCPEAGREYAAKLKQKYLPIAATGN